VVVLSPHLDDGVLSLGGTLARWAGDGVTVRVVTVLANDPASVAPAGPWDAACGFATSGEATRARRVEDARACAVLGVEPAWLPFGDEQYGHGADDGAIWAGVRAATGGARTVLLPGFPLTNPDHEWLTSLVLDRTDGSPRVGFYREQPYALSHLMGRRRHGRTKTPARGVLDLGVFALTGRAPHDRGRRAHPWPAQPAVEWVACPLTVAQWRAKQAALRQYASQLGELGALFRPRLALYELGARGEAVAWPVTDQAAATAAL
jgi:LmbE family N-acetylglucosaminyl deacetylase